MKHVILFVLLLSSYLVKAQDVITIKGVVTDQTNQPVPGATVSEKGTKNAVVADNIGAYSINVKPGAVIVFSFIGFRPMEESANNRKTINVRLLEDANKLNEVVVVGYGAETKRSELTGSISSVSGNELAKSPVQNVAQALQGRIAGMAVNTSSGDPEAQPTMTIRGGTSITQSNEPLYVVDGVPQTDGLNFLDPSDVESIDVMKDAAATALYGSRGANGVILVTTKKAKGGKTRINYDGYVGIRKINDYLPVLNPLEYVKYVYEKALPNVTELAGFTTAYGPYSDFEKNYSNRPGINWQEEIFGQNAINQYHKVGISGGAEDVKYNLFYSKNINEGLMLASGADKDVAKLTVVNNIGKKAVVTGIINYSNLYTYGSGGTQSGGNARLSMLQNLFQYRPVNAIGSNDLDLLDDVVDDFDPTPNQPTFQSPLIAATTRENIKTSRAFNASVNAKYFITKDLTYNGLVSYASNFDKNKFFNSATNIIALRSGGPNGGTSERSGRRFNYNNVLTYAKKFGDDHKADVAIGQEYVYNYFEAFSAGAAGFPTVNNGFYDLGAGTVANFPTSGAEDDKLFSLFTRFNYSYQGKYLFSASLRRDGSSKFGGNNQFGYFPAVSAAWRVSEEKFLKNNLVISDLKLRASYGSSGNNRIANYAALGTFTTGNYGLNNSITPTVYQNALANPNLKWETVIQSNIGVDVGFFKQRITLTAEAYDNRSKDLLYNTRVPASSGFTTQLQNIGKTMSRGIEFTISSVNINNKDFQWNTNLNLAFNKTKVLQLGADGQPLIISSYNTLFTDYILQVGQPVGSIYGYLNDGLYQVNDFNYDATTGYTLKSGVPATVAAPKPGYAKFKDISGPGGTPDGIVNDFDRTIIGDANPKIIGGFNNTFTYKNFDLSVFLNFSIGNDVYNANVRNNLGSAGTFNSNLAFQANRFTYVNANGTLVSDPAELSSLNQGKTVPTIGSPLFTTDEVVEDGSFLRVNNVSLGYTLPKQFLSKLKISNVRIYVTGYNLLLLTKYSGYDPEVSTIGNSITRGVDFSAYPRGKSVVAGLNVSF